jgi:hypothetical protein
LEICNILENNIISVELAEVLRYKTAEFVTHKISTSREEKIPIMEDKAPKESASSIVCIGF